MVTNLNQLTKLRPFSHYRMVPNAASVSNRDACFDDYPMTQNHTIADDGVFMYVWGKVLGHRLLPAE